MDYILVFQDLVYFYSYFIHIVYFMSYNLRLYLS